MTLFLIGLASGILGGMGIGGGTVLIPGLVLFAGLSQHQAQGINLLFFLPVAAASLVVHIKNKMVDYKITGFAVLAGVPAAFAGADFASVTEEGLLRKIIGVFLIIAGIYELLKK
ncbi:MAG: sulfite exporter TauE/SafE family protein [Clostridiaceae bacterium]|nr:sulfite exporter TauE/SafE family protein [Clostridiaceae bacterium]